MRDQSSHYSLAGAAFDIIEYETRLDAIAIQPICDHTVLK